MCMLNALAVHALLLSEVGNLDGAKKTLEQSDYLEAMVEAHLPSHRRVDTPRLQRRRYQANAW